MTEILQWITAIAAVLLVLGELLKLAAAKARSTNHPELGAKLEAAERRVEQLEHVAEISFGAIRRHEAGESISDAILDASATKATDEVHGLITQGLATGKVST